LKGPPGTFRAVTRWPLSNGFGHKLTGFRPQVAPRSVARVVIALSAALVLLAALWLAALQRLDPGRDDATYVFLEDRGGGGPPSPTEIRPRYANHYETSDSWVTLQFFLDDFDPSTGELEGRVAATLDEETFTREFPGSQPPPEITISLVGLFEARSVTVPLGATESASDFAPQSSASIGIESWGAASAFPNDAYGSNNFIEIGSGMGYPSVTLLASQRLAPYHIEARVDATYLNILLKRKTGQVLWIYCIALSPLILLCSLIWLGISRRNSAGAAALEVVVGLLALLPLRQVLVPPNITELTWLDTILGLEFILFVGWLAITVLFLESSDTKQVDNPIDQSPLATAPGTPSTATSQRLGPQSVTEGSSDGGTWRHLYDESDE
jgi:hypothetical protein